MCPVDLDTAAESTSLHVERVEFGLVLIHSRQVTNYDQNHGVGCPHLNENLPCNVYVIYDLYITRPHSRKHYISLSRQPCGTTDDNINSGSGDSGIPFWYVKPAQQSCSSHMYRVWIVIAVAAILVIAIVVIVVYFLCCRKTGSEFV